mmetsp:Transcript_37369/g.78278  ORF Transcript_37369/g.78278 Transcript_37369/m.78278 type:complete len:112 (+) Transcript_37369:1166-1501(+)
MMLVFVEIDFSIHNLKHKYLLSAKQKWSRQAEVTYLIASLIESYNEHRRAAIGQAEIKYRRPGTEREKSGAECPSRKVVRRNARTNIRTHVIVTCLRVSIIFFPQWEKSEE